MSPPVIKFTKMSAGGNDFILIDNLTAAEGEPIEIDEAFVRRVCTRALSVGADGVIVIGPSESAGARMVYHNADGGRAALCGNGVRCVARLRGLRRVTAAQSMSLETDVCPLAAGVEGDNAWFRLPLGVPSVRPVCLSLEGGLDEISRTFEGTLVTAGVPHLVIETREAHGMPARDFLAMAPKLRRHRDLGPEGANVDFITVRDRQTLDVRTYERGVEAETLSSGSGCIASAFAAVHVGKAASPV